MPLVYAIQKKLLTQPYFKKLQALYVSKQHPTLFKKF